MENVMEAKRIPRKPKIIRLEKFDYLLLLGLLPICINLVSSIYKSTQVNWSIVTNEGETSHIKSGFLYYFGNTIDNHKIIFLIAFVLIGFSVYRIVKQYKNTELQIRKARRKLHKHSKEE
jgi:hypothetical protein